MTNELAAAAERLRRYNAGLPLEEVYAKELSERAVFDKRAMALKLLGNDYRILADAYLSLIRPDDGEAVQTLAQDIRSVDGNHDLGAGELAEWLVTIGWRKFPLPPDNG